MKELADGVWQLRGFPPNGINVYLVEDVLVDAATKLAWGRVSRELKGRTLGAHALTHVHPDHQGVSKRVCETYGVPLMCGEADVAAMETGNIAEGQPDHPIANFFNRLKGPPHKVDRALHEGDEVAGFKVIDVPGHSAGHVAFWRESDGVLILGDVLNNMDTMTGLPGLHEPKWFFTPDPERNRQSARKLASLEPQLVLFGHGPALRDTKKFTEFIAGLPE